MKLARINLFILIFLSMMKDHHCEPVWNLAFNKSASQSKKFGRNVAQNSVDGNDGPVPSHGSCSDSVGLIKHKPWWEVDLAQDYYIKGVAISQSNYNPVYKYLTHNFTIDIYGENKTIDDAILCYYQEEQAEMSQTKLYLCVKTIKGRYVRITVHGQPGDNEHVMFCEVKVFGSYESVSNFVKMEGTEIANEPFATRNLSGIAECAMRCHALSKCHVFTVKRMSDIYKCKIYTTTFLVANSTGNPDEVIFIL
ncbi:hypothetical protein LOTGIDRAFT_159946 [Lottia gigantea]|uniref:Apple domain-containing protein n=1 Tax=Lottia gigantea TaxID=225164 RepID=V4AP13_LOTGI|nr:hypothetical protein LOTGIDRAFT_159946 [Lottia gigantea]ESO96530.1 hypothetical protein LOTGIDRAFT_159946 [Lottia gigantea]